MRKFLLLLWLLCPVAALYYHYNDGQDQLARERGVTVSTVLQFAWAVLLSRMTGNRVVAFGETVSGRPSDLDGVEGMVGLFINPYPK